MNSVGAFTGVAYATHTFKGIVESLDCVSNALRNFGRQLVASLIVNLVEYRAQIFLHGHKQVFIPVLRVDLFRAPFP